MDSLPMKKSFAYSEQINIKVRPETKLRVKALLDQGVDFNDLAREFIYKAIEFAEERLSKAN